MDRDFFSIIVISVLFIGLFLGGVYVLENISCNAKTQDMGFDHRFSALGGCQIEIEEGRWIPLDSYYFKEE